MGTFEVAGNRVLVTGTSSGIGRHLAKELAARGASVAVSARRGSLLESLAEDIKAQGSAPPVIMEADLSRRGAAEALAAEAERRLGYVDVLVNNAGGGWAAGSTRWEMEMRGERHSKRTTGALSR